MLLQFLVGNFRSFNKEEILNLIPAKSRIHPGHVLISHEKGRRVRSLPLAVIYGANASGKSNLIRAMSFAQEFIINGTRSDEPTGAVPFRLSPGTDEKPSRFEFVIKHDGVLYTYGFAATVKEVREEWLFAVFQRQEVCLFERITENGKALIKFGKKLASEKDEAQRLQFVTAGTRPNQLFLTEANERNVEALKPLIHWFRDHLTVIWPEAKYRPLILRAHDDKQFADFLSMFLRIADTGVQGIDLKSQKLVAERLYADVPDDIKKVLINNLANSPNRSVIFSADKAYFALRQDGDNNPSLLTLRTRHQRSDGQDVFFDTRDESDGTHRMMHMVPALFNLLSMEDVYVIDEFDRSLHPHLCRLYIDAFLRGITGKGRLGQIILTTHETTLLDLDLLRRDEIWFLEKDNVGASHLTSLVEYKYKVRADLKINKGYLSGRFGAVPLLGDAYQLFSKQPNE